MDEGISLSVLGPIEVRVDGSIQRCSGRQRDLLTRLVIQRSERRAKSALITDLYGDQPIRTADSAFRVVLGQLRKLLEPYQHVVLTGTLYGLDADTDNLTVDAWQFVDGCREGQIELQKGNYKEATLLLENALELWRGSPFGGVTRIVEADEEAQRLNQLRITAQEDFADATLRTGGHTDIVDRLKRWVEEHPERERTRSLHLLALYRSGRQLEATHAIDKLNHYFAEVGLLPTPALKRLCDDIFQQAPTLETTEPTIGHLPEPTATLPAILAAARKGFAGREEIRRLLQAPLSDVTVLIGKPGIGKTALLGQVGHDLLRPLPSAEPARGLQTDPHNGIQPNGIQPNGIQHNGIQRVVYCQCEPTSQTGLAPILVGLGLVPSNGTSDWDYQIDQLLQTIDTHLEAAGLALFVDDIQWANEATMRFLRRLASRHTKPNLAVVCAGWPTKQTETLCALPTVRRIQLRPLDRHETELAAKAINIELSLHLERKGQRDVNRSVVEALWNISGGYPLLLRSAAIAYGLSETPGSLPNGLSGRSSDHLVAAHHNVKANHQPDQDDVHNPAETSAETSDPTYDPTYDQTYDETCDPTLDPTGQEQPLREALSLVVQHVLKTLDEDGIHIAQIASLIGDELDEEQLSAITGRDLAVVRSAVDGLIEIGIVDSSYPLRFRHRLTAEALTTTLNLNELGALRTQLSQTENLPLCHRAKQGLLAAGIGLPLTSAFALSKAARDLARDNRSAGQLVELSELERNLRSKIAMLEPAIDFELCTDLAFAHEANGNAVLGSRYRELSLQLAERQGNFTWACRAVLTAPENGRAIAAGRSNSQISRALNLADANCSQEAILQLRAERVHRLGISGGTNRISNDDLDALRNAQDTAVSADAWIQITRARLCTDLAVATLPRRTEATLSLVHARTRCADNDLRVDSLVLLMRNALEAHDVKSIDALLQQVEAEFLLSARPMDRWTRNILRATALAARGQLSAAYSHAVEAQRLGALYGINDSAISWQLQSSQLLAFSEGLCSLIGIEPDTGEPGSGEPGTGVSNRVEPGAGQFSNPGQGSGETTATEFLEPANEDETMEGNLLPLGLALLAQGEIKLGNTVEAISQISLAQELFDRTAADHYLLVAAGQIVQTCVALNRAPTINLAGLLTSAGTASIIIGMIPGWSMGPALRYAALAEHLAGNTARATKLLLQSADHANATQQYLWELASLNDLCSINSGPGIIGGLSAEQRNSVVERLRQTRNRIA
jgi:DNA-binding SARP family transcriptional activator